MAILYKKGPILRQAGGLVDKFRKRAYNSITPLGYSNDVGSIKRVIGELFKGKPASDNIPVVDKEIFGLSLGQVSRDDMTMWENSPYKPSTGSDSITYLRPKRAIIDSDAILSMIENTKPILDHIDGPYIEPSAGKYFNVDTMDPLANHRVDFGEDDHGTYMSIYDKWDLNNKIANKVLVENPEIYDRYYYEPNSGLRVASDEERGFKKSLDAARSDVSNYMEANPEALKESNQEYMELVDKVQQARDNLESMPKAYKYKLKK